MTAADWNVIGIPPYPNGPDFICGPKCKEVCTSVATQLSRAWILLPAASAATAKPTAASKSTASAEPAAVKSAPVRKATAVSSETVMSAAKVPACEPVGAALPE